MSAFTDSIIIVVVAMLQLANINHRLGQVQYKTKIKFPFKRKACQVYEGCCCRQVSTVVSLVVW